MLALMACCAHISFCICRCRYFLPASQTGEQAFGRLLKDWLEDRLPSGVDMVHQKRSDLPLTSAWTLR